MLRTSRYRFSTVHRDAGDRLFLGPRSTFGYRVIADTIEHTTNEGETLRSIAAFYWRALPNAEHLYWAIADFQPDPIRDVTVPLESGRVVYIPSQRTLEELILTSNRIDEDLTSG